MSPRARTKSFVRKAPHSPAPRVYPDGATDELRNRVAYGICDSIYAGGCACSARKARACETMLSAASRAIMIIDEARPF